MDWNKKPFTHTSPSIHGPKPDASSSCPIAPSHLCCSSPICCASSFLCAVVQVLPHQGRCQRGPTGTWTDPACWSSSVCLTGPLDPGTWYTGRVVTFKLVLMEFCSPGQSEHTNQCGSGPLLEAPGRQNTKMSQVCITFVAAMTAAVAATLSPFLPKCTSVSQILSFVWPIYSSTSWNNCKSGWKTKLGHQFGGTDKSLCERRWALVNVFSTFTQETETVERRDISCLPCQRSKICCSQTGRQAEERISPFLLRKV